MKPLTTDLGPLPGSSPDSAPRVKKAGFLIHGLDAQKQRCMVAAYNEGRLGAKYKAYLLPTGTVEAYESDNIMEAARRETFEETGIDVRELLGGQWYKAAAGETLDFTKIGGYESTSPDFKGVKILKVSAVPTDFTYVSHAGVKKRTQLFEVEVENIELLRNKIKNPYNTQYDKSDGKVVETTWLQIKKNMFNDEYPPFNDMLSWLRTGDMPENRRWNKGMEKLPNLYEGVNHEERTLFQDLEERHFKGQVRRWSHEEWKEFLDELDSTDYKRLSKYFTKIKEHLGTLGITKGDHDVIKLDDKDFPLTFYQEGADVMRVEDYFLHAERLSRKNPYYNDAFIELPPKRRGEDSPDEALKTQYQALKDRFPVEFKRGKKKDERTTPSTFVERMSLLRNLENSRVADEEASLGRD